LELEVRGPTRCIVEQTQMKSSKLTSFTMAVIKTAVRENAPMDRMRTVIHQKPVHMHVGAVTHILLYSTEAIAFVAMTKVEHDSVKVVVEALTEWEAIGPIQFGNSRVDAMTV
jgi:hypothetical protein